MFEWISSPEAWIALSTLIALEVVLGIDNIIFISILVARLPVEQRDRARKLGIGFALVTRLALLFSLAWIIGLTEPWFELFGMEVSGRDLVLFGGGLFLIAKSTSEIHDSLEAAVHEPGPMSTGGIMRTIVQIALLDIVFSLDSVITAVGLVDQIELMVIAILTAVIVMLLAAKPLGEFVDRHPTVKMLALSFLLLIGFTLVVEAFDVHVPKGYIYFAMAFSVFVEILNLRMRRSAQVRKVKLNRRLDEAKVDL